MPIYEYRCEDCREDVEVLVLSKEEKPACPKCDGSRLTRLMSAFSSTRDRGAAPAPSCAPGSGGFS